MLRFANMASEPLRSLYINVSVMILYFSGTGNSRYVASELARLLGEPGPLAIADTDPSGISSGLSRIIWVFPVYSWGVPPVVVRFMRQVCLDRPVPNWMVCTCGDDVGLTPRQWAALVRSMGGLPRGSFSVEMPNTYVTLPGFDVDSVEVADRKLRQAPDRIGAVASAIIADRADIDVVRGGFPWIKSRIIYPWFIRHAMSPKPFASTDACIGCGRCQRECPTHNIRLNAARRPEWGSDCAFCLRCYHTCPRHAVSYGRATLKKGQYLCPLQKVENQV